MAMKTILVDDNQRELSAHGTIGFPMTVNHDDLWAFEGKYVPIHWHNDLEISLPRKNSAIYQVYGKNYLVHPGEGLLLNQTFHTAVILLKIVTPYTAQFWYVLIFCMEN